MKVESKRYVVQKTIADDITKDLYFFKSGLRALELIENEIVGLF